MQWVRAIWIVHYDRRLIYKHTLLDVVRRHDELLVLILLLCLLLLRHLRSDSGRRVHIHFHRLQQRGRLRLLPVHDDLALLQKVNEA